MGQGAEDACLDEMVKFERLVGMGKQEYSGVPRSTLREDFSI
jgi:hypothetical protein